MNGLIIDCSAGMYVSVFTDDKDFECIDINEKRHSDELLISVDSLLRQADLRINEIENICVCIGPGSFTGVRVAISICKGLAIGLKSKIFALSNLDIFNVENKENSILILDGFSDFVYARIFRNNQKTDLCISLSELKDLVQKEKFEIYSANEKVQKKLNKYEILCQNAQNIRKSAFLTKIKNNEIVNINDIMPVYLRASQAEIERNKKFEGEQK